MSYGQYVMNMGSSLRNISLTALNHQGDIHVHPQCSLGIGEASIDNSSYGVPPSFPPSTGLLLGNLDQVTIMGIYVYIHIMSPKSPLIIIRKALNLSRLIIAGAN